MNITPGIICFKKIKQTKTKQEKGEDHLRIKGYSTKEETGHLVLHKTDTKLKYLTNSSNCSQLTSEEESNSNKH